MSHITFRGNLAADPEKGETDSGTPATNFVVIENRRRHTKDGKGWEDAPPNRYLCEVYGTQAENLFASCRSGHPVLVTGSVTTGEPWTDEAGQTRWTQRVKVDEVGFSLRFHTVTAQKPENSSGPAAE